MALHFVSEHGRRADRPFQRLRGNAQPLGAADDGGLGPAGVIAVDVGGAMECEKVKLQKTAQVRGP
jgi:hypothetical protein